MAKRQTTLYWFKHFEYAMGYAPRQANDKSNIDWTRKNLEALIDGDSSRIYGMKGLNGWKAAEHFIELYYGKKVLKRATKAYKEYIETVDAPLYKLRKYLDMI